LGFELPATQNSALNIQNSLHMEPFFTNDATVLGLLIIVLATIFVTSGSDSKGWKKFYTYVPALLLCYFIPALLHYPFGLIAAKWFNSDLMILLEASNIEVSLQTLKGMTYDEIVDRFNIPE